MAEVVHSFYHSLLEKILKKTIPRPFFGPKQCQNPIEEVGNKAEFLAICPKVDRTFFTQDPGQRIIQSCVPTAKEQASVVLSTASLLLLWKTFLPACFSWGGLALMTTGFKGQDQNSAYTLIAILSFTDASPRLGTLSYPKFIRLNG